MAAASVRGCQGGLRARVATALLLRRRDCLMYVFLECLTLLALVALVAVLLFAVCVVLVALRPMDHRNVAYRTQGCRAGNNSGNPALLLSLALQGTILASTDPPAR